MTLGAAVMARDGGRSNLRAAPLSVKRPPLWLLAENPAYLPGGKVVRARFSSFFVYVLEDGQWKFHSGQQAAWPIEPAGK